MYYSSTPKICCLCWKNTQDFWTPVPWPNFTDSSTSQVSLLVNCSFLTFTIIPSCLLHIYTSTPPTDLISVCENSPHLIQTNFNDNLGGKHRSDLPAIYRNMDVQTIMRDYQYKIDWKCVPLYVNKPDNTRVVSYDHQQWKPAWT